MAMRAAATRSIRRLVTGCRARVNGLQDTKAFIVVTQCFKLAAGTLAKADSKRWRRSCVTSRSSAAPDSVSISW